MKEPEAEYEELQGPQNAQSGDWPGVGRQPLSVGAAINVRSVEKANRDCVCDGLRQQKQPEARAVALADARA